ncbi:MAG TPA: DUF5723 family protein [Bacteroidia bacterium]|nr:DUF5723 family protein [Bacteroidia bacterium]
MKRISYILLVIGTIISADINAQWSDAMVEIPAQKNFTGGIYGNADFNSTCITTAFATNFLLGNYIGDNLKQEVSSNFNKFNRIGYSLNYGAYGVWHNDSVQTRVFNFFFALRHKSYINTDFSRNVFNMAFYGNAMYAGQTAKLVPFSLNMLNYQQAEIGMVVTNFGGKGVFGIGVSFLAGQQFLSINAQNASLYTDPTGQNLQFSTNTEMYQTDTAGNRKPLNGYGASMDLYFKAPLKIGKRNSTISLSLTDIGFMFWNNKSLYYHKDTSYYYDGVSINNITDLQNVSFNSTSKDSLQNKYIPYAKKSFFSSIPSTLSINSTTDFGKYHLELGYWYIFNANAVGYYYIQGDKYIANKWMAAAQLGFGGYGTVNAELMLSKQTEKSTFRVALNHIQGLILPTYFGGAGLYLEYLHTIGK